MSIDNLHLHSNPKDAETGLNARVSTGATTLLSLADSENGTASTTSVPNSSYVPKRGGVPLQQESTESGPVDPEDNETTNCL